jgi:hypothetical protein
LQGGGVRSHGTHGDAGVLPISKAGSEATGHMAAPEPTSAGRQGPVLQGTWWCMGSRPTPCLDLKLVCKGTRSARYRQHLPELMQELVIKEQQTPSRYVQPEQYHPIYLVDGTEMPESIPVIDLNWILAAELGTPPGEPASHPSFIYFYRSCMTCNNQCVLYL